MFKRTHYVDDFRVGVDDPPLLEMVGAQTAADMRAGRYCVTLQHAHPVAALHWYWDALRTSAAGPPSPPAVDLDAAVAYLAPAYRRRLSDGKHRLALEPHCTALVRRHTSRTEALATLMALARSIVDYGSQYYRALVRWLGMRAARIAAYVGRRADQGGRGAALLALGIIRAVDG